MKHQDIRTLKILEEIDNDHTPSQRDKNRVKYILTPKGAAEKTRLTYQYIHYSFEFYKRSRHELRNLFQNLTANGVRRIIFYGASDLAEIAYISLQETPISLVAVVDDTKIGEKFLGNVITDPSEIKTLSFDKILITAIESKADMREKIFKAGVHNDRVIMLE
jgi:hypothetical protein